MRNELRSYFYNVTNFLDKKKYISLSLGIVLLSIYRIIDTNNDFGIDYNLIFDLNNKYYIIMQLLLTSFFTIGFLHEFKSKVEMITRFKTRREYFRYIVKHISFLALVIFTVNLSVLFILRLFKHHFTFSCEEYLLYKTPSVLYFTWQIFRNIIYMLFMSYVVSSLYFFIENKRIVYTIFGGLILALFFQNTNLVEFAPLKINGIKKCYVELTIYIVINVLNVSILNQGRMSDLEILSLLSFEELKFVGLATKVISYLTFISIIIKGLFGDYHKNASVLFTRIAKKKWLKKRLVMGVSILLVLRLPLYILLNWRPICLIDMLAHLLVLISTANSFMKNSRVSIVFFMMIMLFMFIKEINIFFLLKMYILVFLLFLPSFKHPKIGR